ncbi:hypothetical protein EJ04DRAFT_466909 [Polyplosphaeria fusca]|uniref:Zn(2)-C6 fungal-type domain-containing protein n=1 Tax=Polyplosphaeria fusca TaxID=682080 RepID=A0A9P4R0B6_9PLEO|nr:hypothetical protein EJ04DRAFT_466909 [Polyplosphaeria fusca]
MSDPRTMAGSPVLHKKIQSRTKVKTGCATCRTRKVKCDENKPFCQKCVGTGRTCDGYDSLFRFCTSQSISNALSSSIKSSAGLQPIRPASSQITPQDIDLLNRYFSTKTIFGVRLGCDEEAQQALQSSLTDPLIRHAILSLKTLRENFETSGDTVGPIAQQTPSKHYGLQQYCMALGGLASNLSSLGPNGLNSALVCCQIFISIEQVRGNYAAMAQHIVQGLKIMHEYRARPTLVAANKLLPAHHDQLPFLDVFIIKVFIAPCKFADPPLAADVTGMAESAPLISPQQQLVASRGLRTIAPDVRIKLTRIATSALEFLNKVSLLKSAGDALQLLTKKASLLDSLEAWLINLESVHTDIRPLSLCFLRFFHQTLKVVLLGALDYSQDVDAELRMEINQLHDIAGDLGERVKAYNTRIITG